ncbi:hypothetical protein KP79_PYT21457 [Mizuhopecten yessoensis]|uniref:Nose resistant-to-fluoxetine protein N-terminal domain-containing protein n=1 Tax=Mizuhopecten yessoensis TaxID=6573 RepID=A0A210Q1F4_MIZYE|nr:hypothetical protein KP79_PYT21457 [Mizuhopecten yessoensis]
MENRQCRFFAMVIVANIIVSLTTKADSTITGQNISVSNRASILADYFIQHEFESHYVYESALAARELIHHVSPGNTSATSELLDAMASYVLVSMPDFLRDPIVQDIAKVIVDEAEQAFQRSNLILNSSNPISEDEMQQILSQFDFVKALTRSITIAKPLIEQYRQEDDSSVYIILLNKAIEVTAYAISTPTFQTVMDIAIEELSQGFLKSGLPERIAKEGTEFLDDSNNTLSIVKTIIESSNTQRLISRSYKVSKPVLDNLYNGDTLFLYTLLTEATGDSTGNSQDPSFLYYFKMLESEFLKTNNKQNQSNGVPASIISEPLSFANVLGQMNLQSVIVSLLGSESAREMLPYNSSVEEDKISDVCYEDMIDFLDAAKDEKEWALQILDSYGKVNPGLLQGNLHFIGSMEQCSKSRSNIKPGEILGNIPRTHQRYPRTLGYRYCRADLLITKEMEEILLQE